VPKTLVESTNGSLMCNAHTTAGHQTATECLMSKAAATAEAATTEAAGMPAAEAAMAAATATTTAARFGDAGRGSNDDRRSKCGFDCEC
jgi:hypothetical protein